MLWMSFNNTTYFPCILWNVLLDSFLVSIHMEHFRHLLFFFIDLLVFIHWAGGRRAISGSRGHAPSWCWRWRDAVHLEKLSLWIEQDIPVWKMMCWVFLQLSVTCIHVLLACSSMSSHIQVLPWCWYFLHDVSEVQPLFGCHDTKTLCMSLSHILWHVVQGQKMFRIRLPTIKCHSGKNSTFYLQR